MEPRHILSAKDFDLKLLDRLFRAANRFKNENPSKLLAGTFTLELFWEPSTRTQVSFARAVSLLGGDYFNLSRENSSLTKGETFSDTIRILSNDADAIIIRHPARGIVAKVTKYASVPLINAGDGTNEHPTQALLDIYTMQMKLGSLDGLTIALVGDLRNGRTIHSLVYLLSLYSNVTILCVSPPKLGLPEDVETYVDERGRTAIGATTLNTALRTADVVYITRLQKERLPEGYTAEDYPILTPELLSESKRHDRPLIMHPLPRVDEISADVDDDDLRAIYFQQAANGVPVRMAVLAYIFRKI